MIKNLMFTKYDKTQGVQICTRIFRFIRLSPHTNMYYRFHSDTHGPPNYTSQPTHTTHMEQNIRMRKEIVKQTKRALDCISK